ncbi:MAG: transposase, partial [Clostridiaceae bacterium]|nr:transposase [Clostridiaceae bacterium]
MLERYWDKDKQQARNKQVCIGKLDPMTGSFIPSRRFSEQELAAGDAGVTAFTTVWGPALLLRQVDREIGLSAVLRKASPELWRDILAMAWYIVITGQALSNADLWLQQHESPAERLLSSQRISELLAKIDEEVRQTFFRLWGGALAKGDRLCYDITSVSSYAEQNEYARWGYNRDKESLPQINLAMVYGQQSQLPVTYREPAGS